MSDQPSSLIVKIPNTHGDPSIVAPANADLDSQVGAAMRRVLSARYSEAEAVEFLTRLTATTLFGTAERKAQDRAYEMLSSRLIKAGAAGE